MPFQKGNTVRRGIKKGNKYIALSNNRIGIILTQKQIAIISAVDFGLIKDYTWCGAWNPNVNSFYAVTAFRLENNEQTTLHMHRILSKCIDPELYIDHIDFDTLNNIRDNLRISTIPESQRHRRVQKRNLSTGIKNIRETKWGTFEVKIIVDSIVAKKTFKTQEEAIDYKAKILPELHGDYACD